LLYTRPIDKITVKEVCERAEINRATFYAHYVNLPTLLDEIEVEKSQELLHALSSLYEGDAYFTTAIDGILRYFKKDRLMCALLLGNTSTGKGALTLMKDVRERSITHWVDSGNVTRQQAEWIFTFFMSGAKELMHQWVLSDFRGDINVLKETMIGIVEKGLNGFVYRVEE
jgi:AcrR family transcriptional regulator